MKRLIIVGSPRTNGRSAHLAEMLFEANIDENPEDELFLVPVSEVEIGPCIGCNGCRSTSGVILKDEAGNEVTVQKHRCVFDDDMQMLYDLLDDADEVTVVSPLYFSGAPAPLKCALDRLQPYFWANARAAAKRPAELHILGEGGDPHGFTPLLTEVKSALAVAGFRLEKAFDWVGKIDENGEIVAEAAVVDVAKAPHDGENAAASADAGASADAPEAAATAAADVDATAAADAANADGAAAYGRSRTDASMSSKGHGQRPKLDLSAGKKGPRKSASGRTRAQQSGRGGAHQPGQRNAQNRSAQNRNTQNRNTQNRNAQKRDAKNARNKGGRRG